MDRKCMTGRQPTCLGPGAHELFVHKSGAAHGLVFLGCKCMLLMHLGCKRMLLVHLGCKRMTGQQPFCLGLGSQELLLRTWCQRSQAVCVPGL